MNKLFTSEIVKFQVKIHIHSLKFSKSKESRTYSISWRRGRKQKGDTEFVNIDAKNTFKNPIVFTSKLKRDKKTKKFSKKLLKFTLREKAERGRVTDVSKGEMDLSKHVDFDNVVNHADEHIKISYGHMIATIHCERIGSDRFNDQDTTYTATEDEETESVNEDEDDEDEDDDDEPVSKSRKSKYKDDDDEDEDEDDEDEESDKKSSSSDLSSDSDDEPTIPSPHNDVEVKLEHRNLKRRLQDLNDKLKSIQKSDASSKQADDKKTQMFYNIQKQRDQILTELHETEKEVEQAKILMNEAKIKTKTIKKELEQNKEKHAKEIKMLEMALKELQADDSADYFATTNKKKKPDQDSMKMLESIRSQIEAHGLTCAEDFVVTTAVFISEPSSALAVRNCMKKWKSSRFSNKLLNAFHNHELCLFRSLNVEQICNFLLFECALLRCFDTSFLNEALQYCKAPPLLVTRNKTSTPPSKVDNDNQFVNELTKLTVKSYFDVVMCFCECLDRQIMIDALLDPRLENVKSRNSTGGYDLRVTTQYIDEYYANLLKNTQEVSRPFFDLFLCLHRFTSLQSST
ncbi:hypothetical protein AKO1_009467 [Acrasis kona]|uniref:C2 NT-type domain-containing protein n=1 Tax=Acrasis kona TaxID=1008807 RepID=A0AAW2ZNE4_9EUKA